MEHEPTNVNEELGHLAIEEAIAERSESIEISNFSASFSGLLVGVGALLMGQSIDGTSEFSAPLVTVATTIMIAAGGWFAASVGSASILDRRTRKVRPLE